MNRFEQLYLDIQAKLSVLEIKVEQLRLENTELRNENIILKKENGELKEKLGLNSKNSSMPSSKELYKIKKETRAKSDCKQGAQIGHKGHSRNMMIADEIIKIDLDSLYCECGGEIGIIAPRIHQKIDIPEIKPHVIDYYLQRGRCRVCQGRKSSSLPANVTDDLFGARVKAAIGALSGFYKNSKREVESILENLFNLTISVGTISNNEARIARKCNEAYEDIELELSYSKILHIDETSHYNKGKMGWCWGFFGDSASLIKLEESRGKKVLENSVFGKDDHIIITDRYAAYNYFAPTNRQICWSHLARDFERFAHSFHVEVKAIGCYLGRAVAELFALKKALSEDKIDILRFLRRARKLRKRTWYYLKNIVHINDVKWLQ